MDLYAENILDHYRNPHGKTDISHTEYRITFTESNPTCGDEITIGLNIENGKITKCGWEGSGCAISQAAMSMLYDVVLGATKDDILKLTKDDVLELLGVPVSNRRMNCALLGLKAVQKAVSGM